MSAATTLAPTANERCPLLMHDLWKFPAKRRNLCKEYDVTTLKNLLDYNMYIILSF